jgi:hypothetical protein
LTIEEVLGEIDRRFIVYGATSSPVPDHCIITNEDVGRWSSGSGSSLSEIYDVLAMHLAVGFRKQVFDFGFCDDILNQLQGNVLQSHEDWPNLFWDVFLAFDAGEYYHSGDDRIIDPVEKYTKPLLDAAIAEYSDRFSRFI